MSWTAHSASPLYQRDGRRCLNRIRRQIAQGSYSEDVEKIFLHIVDAIGKISLKLFPRSHLLRDDVKKEVKKLARDSEHAVRQVLAHLEANVDRVDAALDDVDALRATGKDSPIPTSVQWKQAMR